MSKRSDLREELGKCAHLSALAVGSRQWLAPCLPGAPVLSSPIHSFIHSFIHSCIHPSSGPILQVFWRTLACGALSSVFPQLSRPPPGMLGAPYDVVVAQLYARLPKQGLWVIQAIISSVNPLSSDRHQAQANVVFMFPNSTGQGPLKHVLKKPHGSFLLMPHTQHEVSYALSSQRERMTRLSVSSIVWHMPRNRGPLFLLTFNLTICNSLS